MSEFPAIMTADYWMNSQLSVARHSGGITINGEKYLVVESNLVRQDWLPVYTVLGEKATLDLLRNGTSLKVAKGMADQVKEMRLNNAKQFKEDL